MTLTRAEAARISMDGSNFNDNANADGVLQVKQEEIVCCAGFKEG